MKEHQSMDADTVEVAELAALVHQNQQSIELLLKRVGRRRMKRRFRVLVWGSVIALLLAAVAGGVYASIPSATDGQIFGCYPKGGGALRLIDTQANPSAKCSAGENAASWSPNGSPAHIQEFSNSARPIPVAIPASVSAVTVELWGAGGGGGADCAGGGIAEGGGGGGGAYIRALLQVTPGETLKLTIGKGGTGIFGGDGTAGSATTVMRGTTTLASAGGGGGGTAADCSGFPPLYGVPGAGGTPTTASANATSRHGNTGNFLGRGGMPIQGSVELIGMQGQGGFGFGFSGGDGNAIVSW